MLRRSAFLPTFVLQYFVDKNGGVPSARVDKRGPKPTGAGCFLPVYIWDVIGADSGGIVGDMS